MKALRSNSVQALRLNSVQALIIFLLVSITVLAQPLPTIKAKSQKPLAGRTYLVFAEVKTTNTSSQLVEDMDYKNPNVTSLQVVLTNVTTSGDTTFGEFTIPASTSVRYIKPGVVAVNSTTGKYSPMRTGAWLTVNPGETKPTFVIFQEK